MHNLLKNRRYIGEYRYDDTIVPGGILAIVPQDVVSIAHEYVPHDNTAAHNKVINNTIICPDCGTSQRADRLICYLCLHEFKKESE